VIAQISLFVKLKLQNCAPIPGPPAIGFFVRAEVGIPDVMCHAENRPGVFARAPSEI
jgi:hypothetical protein